MYNCLSVVVFRTNHRNSVTFYQEKKKCISLNEAPCSSAICPLDVGLVYLLPKMLFFFSFFFLKKVKKPRWLVLKFPPCVLSPDGTERQKYEVQLIFQQRNSLRLL